MQGRFPYEGPRSPDLDRGSLSRTGSLKGRELRRQFSMSEMGRPHTPDFERGRPRERGRPPGERGMSQSRGEMRERERERDRMMYGEPYDHIDPRDMR